jgi:hypothetical protein
MTSIISSSGGTTVAAVPNDSCAGKRDTHRLPVPDLRHVGGAHEHQSPRIPFAVPGHLRRLVNLLRTPQVLLSFAGVVGHLPSRRTNQWAHVTVSRPRGQHAVCATNPCSATRQLQTSLHNHDHNLNLHLNYSHNHNTNAPIPTMTTTTMGTNPHTPTISFSPSTTLCCT